ncbi:MAG: secretin N-terminal domain-containing protein [Thermodesulfobacteriota bacterium]
MGKKILGAVLVATIVVVWGYPFCAHAQQRFSAAGAPEKPTPSPLQRWEGKTITLYTDDEDIKAVFKAISKILDVPITFGEGITEFVSVEFKNQPLREAFDFLIHQFNLDYTEDAQSIHVYRAGRGGTLDVLIPLDRLDLQEAKTALERFGLQKRDLKIVFDAPTNTIFVSGSSRDVANVQRVVKSLEDSRKKTTLGRPEIRYFPLRYAKVSDIQLTIGKSTVTVPGLVKTLPLLLGLTRVGEQVTTVETPEQRRMGSDERRRYSLRMADQLRADQIVEQARAERDAAVPQEASVKRETSVSAVLVGAEPGTMSADPRANMIIIRDYPEKLDEYAKIIKQLDQPMKMVKLDVIIVEAGKDFAREVGIGWTGYKRRAGDRRQYFPASSGTARDVFDEQFTGTPSTALNLMPLPETAAGTPISAYGLAGTFIYTGAQWTLFGVLSAAETKGLSRTVNKSSIVTMDNMQAIVQSKTTVTYKLQTGGDNPTVESKDIDAGIVLTVTPHIVEGEEGKGMIELVVTAERSSFLTTRTDGIPEKATTTLTTQAVIGDQATLVVGGLFENRFQEGETGIPCLMSVPVAGYLFKTASARDPKTNILFFMSPTIIALDKIPYEGPEMKDAVERGERELKQIDPEKRETLIEKRPY